MAMNKCCWLYAKDRIAVYAACFIGKTISELVDAFNQDVGSRGWTQDRAYYHEALMNAFAERGVDTSAVTDGVTVSFAHRVRYDETSRALEISK